MSSRVNRIRASGASRPGPGFARRYWGQTSSCLSARRELQTTMAETPALRILHVVSSLEAGRMEQFAIRLAREQRRSGHDAAVLAVRGGPLLQTAREMGVPVTVLRGAGPVGRGGEVLLRMFRGRADVVHAHN